MKFTRRDLYGGAISCNLPSDWIDASRGRILSGLFVNCCFFTSKVIFFYI